jgi:hypothetical protein
MILNAKNNNFRLEIPKNFYFDTIVDKYEYIIKKLPCPYTNIRDYINASIQEVTVPEVSLPTVTQQSLHNPDVPWKGPWNMEKSIAKELTVTFKLYEGYLNYWILYEQLHHFYKYSTKAQAFPDLYLSFLDNTGYELFTFRMVRVIFNEISNLSLSFSSNVPEFQTFTCGFVYTDFELLKRLS